MASPMDDLVRAVVQQQQRKKRLPRTVFDPPLTSKVPGRSVADSVLASDWNAWSRVLFGAPREELMPQPPLPVPHSTSRPPTGNLVGANLTSKVSGDPGLLSRALSAPSQAQRDQEMGSRGTNRRSTRRWLAWGPDSY